MFIRSRLSHYSSRIFKEYNRSICESQPNFGIVFRLLSCTDKHCIFTTLLTLSFYPCSVMLGRGNVANKKSPRQGLWPHSEGKKVSCSGMGGHPQAGEERIVCSTKEDKLVRWNRNPGLHSNPLLGGIQEGKCKQFSPRSRSGSVSLQFHGFRIRRVCCTSRFS